MKSLARFVLFLLLLLVVIAGFLFTLNNTLEVSLWLGTELGPAPLGVWVLLAFAGGGLAGLVLGAGFWRRVLGNLQVRQLKNALERTEKELAAMKSKNAGPDNGANRG